MALRNMRIIALLPMKANSERVKGKNFRELCGKPLFRWALDALLSVDEIDQVIINTDAREILKNNGLEDSDRVAIRDRRPEICGDHVSMNRIIEDDVRSVSGDIYLMTHTTNPFISPATIRHALTIYQDALEKGENDSLFTVNKIQARFYRDDGSAVNHDPRNLIRTQDLEPWFEENSNLYCFTKESFDATNARIGRFPRMYVSPKIESIDIDTPDDWELAVSVGHYVLGRGSE